MKSTAIILSGALAKGAFEAGALHMLTQNPRLNIRSIVATSSGALNGLALAAGITSNRVALAMDVLVSTWAEKGDWINILDFTIKGAIKRQGLSTSNKLRKLVKNTIERLITSDVYPIELKFVLTQLSGRTDYIENLPITTFEGIASFDNLDFYSLRRRERIYDATIASAAFPGMFMPVDVSEFGMCYDGGLVNDTPIKYALENKHIDKIIIISPFPAISESPGRFSGLNLASRMGDIMVNERLYRDLINAEKVNYFLKRLTDLNHKNNINDDQLRMINSIFDNKKEVEIIQIRPKKKLDGNGFSGLFNKNLRLKYIEAGMNAAKEIKL